MSLRHPMVRSVLPPLLVVLGAAALAALVYRPWYVNYDTRYALVWAQDLVGGFTPAFEAPFAPTPHPLWNALATVALVFGDGADDVMLLIVFLSFGAIVWLVYALGAELFGRWAGVVAAVAVMTRAAILRDVVLGYLDVTFAALVIGAVLLEVRRPRRGVAVLAVLAIAGLLRPEAWALALLYTIYAWRWLAPRDRATAVALVLAAPLVWIASDTIITGDPLHSLHGTAALAEENERRRSVGDVPYWSLQYLGFILRIPLLVGIPIGLYLAWRRRHTRAAAPVAVALLLLVAFAAGPVFGLPLIGRYLRAPAALLAVFYGGACLWWLQWEPSRERTVAAVVGVACLLLSFAYIPNSLDQHDDLIERRDRESALFVSLRDLAEADSVQRAFARCPDVTTTDHRPVPHLRWWLNADPGTVATTETRGTPRGRILIVPRGRGTVPKAWRQHVRPKPYRPPPGYERIHINRAWRAFASPGCA